MDNGGYNLMRCIGTGLFGSVYEGCSQKQPHIKVALKTYDKYFNHVAIHESKALRRACNHKNIVKLLDFPQIQDRCFLVFELCNRDLFGYLRHNKLDREQRLYLMYQCSDGLHYLHTLKPSLIHRNIHPNSILVHSSDNHITIKLSSFTLAKVFQEEEVPTVFQDDFYSTAAPLYMVPELSCDDGVIPYTFKVDIFAMGLVFQFIYNNDKNDTLDPELEESGHDNQHAYNLILANKKNEPLPQLFEVHGQDVESMINTMTQFHPEERPTMQEVMCILDELLTHGSFSCDDLQKKWKDGQKQDLVRTCVGRAFFGGNYEVGKSSLVRSLLFKRPYLMHKDDRTVVLDLRSWDIYPDATITLYDLGGHPCYQQIGHLFHSNTVNNINVIPHDITSNDYASSFHWITDVVMRSPESSIELVLTKSDCITNELDRQEKKDQFTTYMKQHLKIAWQIIENKIEQLKMQHGFSYAKKNKVVQKYKEIAANIDTNLHMVSCKIEADPGLQNFHDAIIRKLQNDEFKIPMPATAFPLYQYLGKLGVEKKQRQKAKSSQSVSTLAEQDTILNKESTSLFPPDTQPENLQKAAQQTAEAINEEEENQDYSTDSEQIQFITFEEAIEVMPKEFNGTSADKIEELKVCLRCLHRHGLLMWFEQSADLEKLIFNDIGSFVSLLKSLFHHNIASAFSYDALNRQQKLFCAKENITKSTYASHVKKLQDQGLLSVQLLSVFVKRFGFHEHVKPLIEILEHFNIVFTLPSEHCNYVYFPWYVQSKPTPKEVAEMINDVKLTDPTSHCLHVRLSGSIPSAFFHYFSVGMFKYLDPATTNQVRRVWKDGFFATISRTRIYLEYNQSTMSEDQIDIYIKSPLEKRSMRQSWSFVQHCDDEIKKLIRKWWPGMIEDFYLLCGHCEDGILPLPTTGCHGDIHHWPLEDIISTKSEVGRICYCPKDLKNSFPSILIHPLPKDDDEIKACLEELKLYYNKPNRMINWNINLQDVEEETLDDISEQLGDKWMELGRKLGIKMATLENIREDYRNRQRDAAMKMLVTWKLNTSADVNTLNEALRKVMDQ